MNSEETENQNEAIVIILVFLLLYLIPATIYFLYKLCCGSICSNSFEDEDETKKRKKKSTTSNYKCMLLNITIYVVLVGVFYAYLQKVEPVEDLRDPFEILEITSSASKRKIKKAYRKLSLKTHPDKPGGDANKFREVHDAYRTLTDPEAKRNWQLYGHPDGPQMYRVKVLPMLYADDGAKGPLLFIYLIFVLGMPTLCYCYCFTTSNEEKKEMEQMARLLSSFGQNMKKKNVDIFNVISTLASTLNDDSNAKTMKGNDNNDDEKETKRKKEELLKLKEMALKCRKVVVEEGGNDKKKKKTILMSTLEILTILHLNRREKNIKDLFDDDNKSKQLSAQYTKELGNILINAYPIILKMLELAIQKHWLKTTQTIGYFAGYLAQGFSPLSKTIGKENVLIIQNKECNYTLPKLKVKSNAVVLDEDEISCGDYVTCTINLSRFIDSNDKYLKNGVLMSSFLGERPDVDKNPGVASVYLKGTQIGAIDYDPAMEETWLVTLGIDATNYLIGASIVTNIDETKDITFTFTAPEQPGKLKLDIKAINLNHCYCDVNETLIIDVVVLDGKKDDDEEEGEGGVIEDDMPSTDDDDEEENDDFVVKE